MTTESAALPSPDADWSDEHRVAVLLVQPAVQQMVAACTQNARSAMSAEQFLAETAAVLPLGLGSALRVGAARGRTTALNRGLKVERVHAAEFAAPIGRVTAAILCSLARNAQAVTAVDQRDEGAVLTADIPSDRKTFGGVLTVEIWRMGTGTAVAATAVIPGQIYDWGKSKKVLATLVADVPAFLVR